MRRAKAADIENNNRLNFITLFQVSLLENRAGSQPFSLTLEESPGFAASV